ncbi:MAG: LPS export ABC transporter permease LptF [Gammaproteobacteria bacterium]|nr:LPS export ABC transporter permease LptF [Gammaproteobacteria bacterium]
MIIDRYLFKEIVISLISVVTVLLLIFSSKHFVRYMSDAAAGELPTSMIFQLLSLFTLSYLVLIVPFAIYLSVIITLGRLYKDNEITAAEACGLGLPRIIKSIFYLSLFLSVIVGVLSLWVAPWAEAEQYNIRDQARAESEFGFIAPGRFHEIRGGRGVFYVESIAERSGKMGKVFVYLKDEGKTDVFTSLTGYTDLDEETGSHFIVLENGYRFEVVLDGKGDVEGYRLHDYGKSGIRIAKEEEDSDDLKIIERSTVSLFDDESNEAQAELHWRIAMPISCVLLTMMAVLLSKTNPRQGRFGKLFIALLAYIVYVYVLMLTRSGLKNGDIPMMLGMWWVHGLALIFIVILLGNQFGWRWFLLQIGLNRNSKTIEGLT